MLYTFDFQVWRILKQELLQITITQNVYGVKSHVLIGTAATGMKYRIVEENFDYLRVAE